jgi:hypothetical protein
LRIWAFPRRFKSASSFEIFLIRKPQDLPNAKELTRNHQRRFGAADLKDLKQ